MSVYVPVPDKDKGYQEASGVYSRELIPSRFLYPYQHFLKFNRHQNNDVHSLANKQLLGGRADGFIEWDGLTMAVDSVSNTIANPNHYNYQSGNLTFGDSILGENNFLIGDNGNFVSFLGFGLNSFTSPDLYRILWYNYDEYKTFLANNNYHFQNAYIAALSGYALTEPLLWLYHDFGPSGNFTRRVYTTTSFPYDTTLEVINNGEVSINPLIPRDQILDRIQPNTPAHIISSSPNLSTLAKAFSVPWKQAHSLIRQYQSYYQSMYDNPHINSRHPSFPEIGLYNHDINMSTFTTNQIGCATVGMTFSNTVFGGGGNTRCSGIPVPAFDMSKALQLNNLSLKPTGYLDASDIRDVFLPGSGRLFTLDMAQQVIDPWSVFRNVCGYGSIEKCRSNGLLGVLNTHTIPSQNGIVGYSDNFKGGFPLYTPISHLSYYSNIASTGTLRCGNSLQNLGPHGYHPNEHPNWQVELYELGLEFYESDMDIFRSELHFSTNRPVDIDIEWSTNISSKYIQGTITDRFGNTKSAMFQWKPLFINYIHNDILQGPWTNHHKGNTLANRLFQHNKIPEFTAQVSPCSGQIYIPARMLSSGNIVNYFSRFLVNDDLNNPILPEGPHCADVDPYPFVYSTGNLLRSLYSDIQQPYYTLFSFVAWELRCDEGRYSWGDIVKIPSNDSLLRFSPNDISLSINDISIPITDYGTLNLRDKNGQIPSNYTGGRSYLNQRNLPIPPSVIKSQETGFDGRWTSLMMNDTNISTLGGVDFRNGIIPYVGSPTGLFVGFPLYEEWPCIPTGVVSIPVTSDYKFSVTGWGTGVDILGAFTDVAYDVQFYLDTTISYRNSKDETVYGHNIPIRVSNEIAFGLPATEKSLNFLKSSGCQILSRTTHEPFIYHSGAFLTDFLSGGGKHYQCQFYHQPYATNDTPSQLQSTLIDDKMVGAHKSFKNWQNVNGRILTSNLQASVGSVLYTMRVYGIQMSGFPVCSISSNNNFNISIGEYTLPLLVSYIVPATGIKTDMVVNLSCPTISAIGTSSGPTAHLNVPNIATTWWPPT